MTWLTWRQFRTAAVTAAVALATVGIVLAVTGPNLAHLYDASGVASCNPNGNCRTVVSAFLNDVPKFTVVVYFCGIVIMLVAPALLGVFWGAPLVTREVEARTFPLAWNQSVTRAQWMAVKLGLAGLASLATAGLLSLMLTWWSGPLDYAAALNTNRFDFDRIGPIMFPARGIVPIGYAAFAFALGVTAGLLLQRTLPAMATTLAGYAVVQVAWPMWIRQHLIAPAHATVALDPANIFRINEINNSMTVSAMPTFSQQGAWVLSSRLVGPSGRPVRIPAYPDCMSGSNSATRACLAWIGKLHLRQVVAYEPASRFWEFQWAETAIFVAAALALAGFCVWRIRSR
jgi:hypothetical protein